MGDAPDRLTRDDLDWLFARLGREVAFYTALRRRLDKRGYPPDDKLYRLAVAAQDAVHSLRIEVHYTSCGSGVMRGGKASEDKGPAT